MNVRARLAAAVAIGAALPGAAAAPSQTAALAPVVICHVTIPPAQAAVPGTLAGWAEGAQLFQGLGNFHRTVTTTSPQAQLYFDQGMRWLWAFNHDEATRSFARAAMLDPGCAMCFWGVALTIGPNYNLPLMSAPRGQVAFAALQSAQALAPHATPLEQALIAALAKRYPTAGSLTPDAFATVQSQYAAEMKAVAARYPADDDVVTLAAEALMTANAWKLWTQAGAPAPGTPEILALLEGVLARNPNHPGANHYYIHAVESSPNPARAVPAAERLGAMMPGAGHLVHMPAHIFQRVGRYADAAEANHRAAAADLAYYARTAPPDYYGGYTAHNWQFEAFSAAAIGRSAEAISAIAKSRLVVSDATLLQMPGSDWVMGMEYTVPARFGQWAALAATPAPDPRLPGLTAAWHWAHGSAMAALGKLPEARADLDALARSMAMATASDSAGLNTAPDIYKVALLTLQARIAGANGFQANRIALLTQAVHAEDALLYNEPADWFLPARHMLGRALLENNRPADAEIVYRAAKIHRRLLAGLDGLQVERMAGAVEHLELLLHLVEGVVVQPAADGLVVE